MEKDIMSSVFGDTILDRKTVRISQKRQFTIVWPNGTSQVVTYEGEEITI